MKKTKTQTNLKEIHRIASTGNLHEASEKLKILIKEHPDFNLYKNKLKEFQEKITHLPIREKTNFSLCADHEKVSPQSTKSEKPSIEHGLKLASEGKTSDANNISNFNQLLASSNHASPIDSRLK